ncbi:MAG: glycoside hydrolase family 38 C-terminal domain-containing protein, partial [Terriglobia bacterium]
SYRGELYSADLENIFPDAVSSRIRLKLAIKGAEGNLLMAEKLAGLAFLYGKPYPAESMTELWKKQLFLAHHDISPGTGIDQIYEEAWQYINDIKLETRALTRASVRHLARAKEKSPGREIIVFNTNNWEVTDWVEAEVQFAAGFADELAVSFNGQELPTEVIDPARDAQGRLAHCKLGFFASVPALGYRVYQVVSKSREFPTKMRVKDNQVTTPFFRLEIDPQTGILCVFAHDGSKLVEGNELVIDEEVGDLYFHKSHLKQPIGAEGGGGVKFAAFKPEETTVRQTPLRATITYRSEFYCLRWPYYLTEKFGNRLYRHKTMDICKQVTVYQDSPRIDFVTTFNTEQSHVRVRLHFDTCMVAPEYVRQTQFGMIALPRERTLEEGVKVPSLTLVTAEENQRGLAFLSSGVPINEIKAGWVHYTLLRSVSVLSADGVSGPLIPTPGAMELGRHVFTYSLYPYQGDWHRAGIHRRVAEFSHPLLTFQLDRKPAEPEFEGLTLEPDNLVVSCLKKTERDDSLILRFFETKGEKCRARLTLPPQVKAAR